MVLNPRVGVALLTSIFVVTSCRPTRPAAASVMPPLVLVDTAGDALAIPADLGKSKATVIVFYADHCPCFHVHEERLRRLERDYRARGVRLLIVDSEVDATADRDARASAERRLPAITLDPGAKLADALGAEYATFTVVLDGDGLVRYRGGLDSDKNNLHEDAQPFVREALADILAGRDVRMSEGKTLGCALMKH